MRFTHLYCCCSFSEWMRICWLQVRVMFCKYLGAWLMHFHHLFYYLLLLLSPTNLLPATGIQAGDVAQITGGAAEALLSNVFRRDIVPKPVIPCYRQVWERVTWRKYLVARLTDFYYFAHTHGSSWSKDATQPWTEYNLYWVFAAHSGGDTSFIIVAPLSNKHSWSKDTILL